MAEAQQINLLLLLVKIQKEMIIAETQAEGLQAFHLFQVELRISFDVLNLINHFQHGLLLNPLQFLDN